MDMYMMKQPGRTGRDFLSQHLVPEESDWSDYKAWMKAWLVRKPYSHDSWYFVEQKWLSRYRKWLNSDGKEADPGPVETGTARPDLLTSHQLENHFPVLDLIWNHFMKRFTIAQGHQIIKRETVIKDDKYVIEKTPLNIYIGHSSTPEKWELHGASRNNNCHDIAFIFKNKYNINNETRIRVSVLWCREQDVWEVIKYDSETLEAMFGLEDPAPMTFMLEIQMSDGSWPRTRRVEDAKGQLVLPSKHVATDHVVNGYMKNTKKIEGGRVASEVYKGLCGLKEYECNHYMTTMIQVFAAMPSVRNYFLTDTHLAHLNTDNPLGRGGNFARGFGDLVKHIWSGRYSEIKIENFKKMVAHHNQEYEGNNSHDAHEFLLFLLDALHEDCNRILSKPYTTLSEEPGRPVTEMAAEAWSVFKKRNESVMVDLFYGLTQSTTTCLECKNSNHTFEPTPCLSLSIPTRRIFIRVCFRSYDTSKPFQILKVALHEGSTLYNIRELIAAQVGIPVSRIATLQGSDAMKKVEERSYEWDFMPQEPNEEVTTAVEVPEGYVEESDEVLLVVKLRRLRTREKEMWTKHAWRWDDVDIYSQPFYVRLPKNCTYDQAYDVVYKSLMAAGLKEPAESWSSKGWTAQDKATLMEFQSNSCMPVSQLEGKVEVPGLLCENWVMQEDKRYIFALVPCAKFGYRLRAPSRVKDQESMYEFMNKEEPGVLMLEVEFHPNYITDYLKEVVTDKPNVKVLQSYNMQSVKRPVLELMDCINLFHQRELLGLGERWYCDKCKRTSMGRRSAGLWTLPHYLVIHLKRFQYSATGLAGEVKLLNFVRFPVTGLDLDPYVTNPEHEKGSGLYDLVSVINHFGLSSELGNNAAFVLHSEDQCWYYTRNQEVYRAFPEELQSRLAYVLIYKRRGAADLQFVEPEDGVSEPEIASPPTPPPKQPMNPYLFPGMSQSFPRPMLHADDAPYFPFDMDMPVRVRENFAVDDDAKM